jgi:hypothetical protein
MSHASRLIFLATLTLGLGAGLYIGWVAAPVEDVDTSPQSLQTEYKDDYVLMIAAAYTQDQRAEAARARLAALGYNDLAPAIATTARRLITAQTPEADLRRLAQLAAALNALPPDLQSYLP